MQAISSSISIPDLEKLGIAQSVESGSPKKNFAAIVAGVIQTNGFVNVAQHHLERSKEANLPANEKQEETPRIMMKAVEGLNTAAIVMQRTHGIIRAGVDRKEQAGGDS